jgi:5-methylcytosine-specific restriction endonuclease McrA
MARFDDALRGYAHAVLKRDDFICRYCGLDGKVWPNWLHLSWDHLLPVGHPLRDDPAYIVAACRFCNGAHNRRRWDVEGKSAEELVAQKKPYVRAKREEYQAFWRDHVAPRNED